MKQTKIRFEPGTVCRLQALHESQGWSIAAIVRWCVDQQLTKMEEQSKRTSAASSTDVPLTGN